MTKAASCSLYWFSPSEAWHLMRELGLGLCWRKGSLGSQWLLREWAEVLTGPALAESPGRSKAVMLEELEVRF